MSKGNSSEVLGRQVLAGIVLAGIILAGRLGDVRMAARYKMASGRRLGYDGCVRWLCWIGGMRVWILLLLLLLLIIIIIIISGSLGVSVGFWER